MQLMGEGDKWQLYCPSELAYGDAGRGKFIGPGAVLIFEMEILKVHGSSKPKPQRPAEALSSLPAAAPAASAPFDATAPATAPATAAAIDVTDASGEAQPREEQQPKAKRPKPSAAPLGSALQSAASGVAMTTTPAIVEPENAPPNVPAVALPPKAVAAAPSGGVPEAELEAATNRAFDEGVDTTLEAMASMLSKLQVPTLQQALSDLSLPTSGSKGELSERLTGALSGA